MQFRRLSARRHPTAIARSSHWQATRFSDGSLYGVWYGSLDIETTVYETAWHWYQFVLDSFAGEHGISSPSLRPGLTLLEFFDADVSGRDFAHGKPHPEMFLTAARELGTAPEAAIVMEDAAAGITAAKAGGMAAIGVARAHDAGLLSAARADIVVTTFDQVDLAALSAGRLATKR